MSIDPQASDEKLARWLQQGAHGAFDEIMSRYKGRLYAFICRYVADREEAYDLVQESFINIYQKIHLYDANRKFSTWAFQVALNKCRDWGRKKTLAKMVPFSSMGSAEEGFNFLDNIADQGADPEHALMGKTELESLAHLVAKLPEKLKVPLIMCVLEDMSQEECATILGVSQKTVETRIYRARKKLSEAYP
ncbi:MAG: RNA polymerase sigma factor [Emcibacter sp.]|nr:RNA polymerase sigma factor [Emcibacter sp.]